MAKKTTIPFLQMEHITKRFGDLIANNDISMEVAAGEIHCLLGENGAGKTTLMNILYGIWRPDGGNLRLRGQILTLKSPKDALDNKIGMVSQHFSLVSPMTVSENIVLANIPHRQSVSSFLIDEKSVESRVSNLAKRYGFKINTTEKVEDLSIGEQQRVEILKALYNEAEILILDEPTAVLTSQEIDELFGVLRSMTSQGHSIIFITHKLREALLCDRITVLREGRVVAKLQAANLTQEQLIEAMFARKELASTTDDVRVKSSHHPSRSLFEVKDLSASDDRGLAALKEVSFQIPSGTIMGIAGVAGNGQRELVEIITGLRGVQHGNVRFCGEDITNCSTKIRRQLGIVHIPEDKVKRGSFNDLCLWENLILGQEDKQPFVHRFLANLFPILKHTSIHGFARDMILLYGINTKNINMKVRHLSGGNLQKLLLARELSYEPELIVASQPTRGLDALSVQFVHQKLLEQKGDGKIILLVSYDLDEIMELSDSIGVMFEGKLTVVSGDKPRKDIERMMVSL